MRRLKDAVAISEEELEQEVTANDQIHFAILVEVAGRTVNRTECRDLEGRREGAVSVTKINPHRSAEGVANRQIGIAVTVEVRSDWRFRTVISLISDLGLESTVALSNPGA